MKNQDELEAHKVFKQAQKEVSLQMKWNVWMTWLQLEGLEETLEVL